MNYTEQSAAKKIESISPGTLVVGIDIAKASHCGTSALKKETNAESC